MRILFLSHFFPPEIGAPQTRILETAVDLQDLGHEVAVLTTFPNYPSGTILPEYRGKRFMQEEIAGIPVVRGPLFAAPNRGFVLRTLSHISFALSALPTARKLPWKPDAIVVDMHPLFLCLTAAALGKAWGAPYVLNAGDLIPEQAVAFGVMKNPVAIRGSRALANFVIRRAGYVVAFSRGIHSALIERGIPAEQLGLIYYGANVDMFQNGNHDTEPLPQLNGIPDDAFVVTYAGTYGLAHGLSVVIEAAKELRDKPDIQFLFVGDGGEKERLRREAREAQVDNITFIDPLPRHLLPALYRRSDACVVTLKRSEWLRKNVLLSKVFEVMAAGRPALVAADGETADLVQQANAGICVPSDSPAELAGAIETLKADAELRERLGQNGQQYIERNFSREQQSLRYDAVLRQAIERSSASSGRPSEEISPSAR